MKKASDFFENPKPFIIFTDLNYFSSSHSSPISHIIPVQTNAGNIALRESYILHYANTFASLSFPANDCWSRIDTHCCWLMRQTTIGYKHRTCLPSIVSVDDQINGKLKE